MQRITIVMLFLVLGLIAYTLIGKDMQTLTLALQSGGKTFLLIFPLIILAFISAGLISVLFTQDKISHWLGKESGWRGILLGALAGALVPGGPYVYFPLAATFMLAGANIGAVISFVTAKNLWSLSRLPIEFALLGPQLTIIRFLITLIFPPLLGKMADLLFSRYAPKIKFQVAEIQGRDLEKSQPGK